MKPLISIITVCYNASKEIVPTLESVKQQTFTDFEHIIVDGASSDSTLEIVKAHRLPSTIILSEKDNGIYDAMNKGLKMAKGEYVVFLNSGDSFHNNMVLERVAEAAKDDNPGVIYGQTIIVDRNRQYISTRHLIAPESLSYKSFSNGMVVCHQAFFVLTKLAPEFNLGYRFSSDFDWCIRILQKSDKNVYLGSEPVIDYLNEGATTHNHTASLKERFKIMVKYFGFMPTALRHIKFLFRSIKRMQR